MAIDAKKTIAETLFRLLERKPVDKITVKELVDACGISRQGFYYHFRDIMEVVEWAAAQTLQETVDASMKAATPREALKLVILILRRDQKLIRRLMDSQRRVEIERLLVQSARAYMGKMLRAKAAGLEVSAADLEESIEVVIAGYQKKNAILTDEEKKIVAYHEIGHALVAAKQQGSAPVQKITIVPRTSGALGYTMQVEEGNHYLMSQEELENKIATYTGGRAAEELVFHSASTGASNDIEQATKLARAMITRYGMSQDFDMVALETVNNQYLGGDASLACSAETAAEIDRQVVDLVKKQHEKALNILTENREKLDELAEFLYEKETITGEEFMAILNG